MSAEAASGARTKQKSNFLLGLVLFLIFEYIVAIICMMQQIATTHDSALGLLQGGIMVPTHMTGMQLHEFMANTLDKDNKIAYSIAFVTQIVFLMSLMPYSPIQHRTLRIAIIVVFLVLEVTSDLWYASATGTTIGGAFTWIFNTGGGGWLVTLSYIIAMSAGSTIVLVDALHKTEMVIRSLFHTAQN